MVHPGKTWTFRRPDEVGLQAAKLEAVGHYLGGRGCVVRHGAMVHVWGEWRERGDVASAAKPWYAHFLFRALEEGRIAGLDDRVVCCEPRLQGISAALGHKDREVTWRHLANQTSCYGVQESPGAAFDYNDWQMALFWDTLFLRVYGTTHQDVDQAVLHPKLTDVIQCEDDPTFMAFGPEDRPGRLGVSPRDFARFGLLYLRRGEWKGHRLLSPEHATMAVSNPLPLSIPRTGGVEAEMIAGQRTIGSQDIPDDQTDHFGSYSWLWWANGTTREGERYWPSAPANTFAALGHANGQRGMAVVPDLDVVMAWNDTTLGERSPSPHPLDVAFALLMEAAG